MISSIIAIILILLIIYFTYKKENYDNLEAVQNTQSLSSQDITNVINQKYGCKIDPSDNTFDINGFKTRITGENRNKSIVVDNLLIQKMLTPYDKTPSNAVFLLNKQLPNNLNISETTNLSEYSTNGIVKSGAVTQAMINNNRVISANNNMEIFLLNNNLFLDKNTNNIYNLDKQYMIDASGTYFKLDSIPAEIKHYF